MPFQSDSENTIANMLSLAVEILADNQEFNSY